MGEARLVWAILAPWTGGLLAVLCLSLRTALPGMRQRLDVAALVALCGGLLAVGPFVLQATNEATLLGVRLAAQPLSKAGLLASDASLLCAVFIAWAGNGTGKDEEEILSFRSRWVAVGASFVGGLLAASLLVSEPLVQVLCLFMVGIFIGGLCLLQVPARYVDDDNDRTLLALRLSAELKYLATCALGTGFMLIGLLVMSRYSMSLENRGLLQTGLAVLCVGLVVRAGSMPFSAALPDMVRSAPAVAVMALGASLPVVVTLGRLLLSPTEGNAVGGASLAWLGAAGAFLAGLRALYAGHTRAASTTSTASIMQAENSGPILVAMSAALPLGWALFGVFSGLPLGAAAASMLGVNIALAVPLLVASSALQGLSPRLYLTGTAVGALSLLGLPPFGGFRPVIMLAQAAANLNGLWLLSLLLGSLMLAGAWLGYASRIPVAASATPSRTLRSLLASPLVILVWVLIAAQIALFFLSGLLSQM